MHADDGLQLCSAISGYFAACAKHGGLATDSCSLACGDGVLGIDSLHFGAGRHLEAGGRLTLREGTRHALKLCLSAR